jgi:zinc/manganese transport system permease protein
VLSGLFSGFMVGTWLQASVMAVAAGAALIGANTLLGVGTFSLLGVLAIARWGRRGQHDVVTALCLVTLLGIGSLFLSLSTQYAEQTFSLLFGEPLAVSSSDLLPTAVLGAACTAMVIVLFRPLMLSSIAPELAAARGIRPARVELLFLLTVGVATTMALPVVGALLVFSLMIGPPATARFVTDRPVRAMAISGALGLITVWVSITASFWSNWPIGFFVGTFAVVWYVLGRGLARRGAKRGPVVALELAGAGVAVGSRW